jgi:hypothetical protein
LLAFAPRRPNGHQRDAAERSVSHGGRARQIRGNPIGYFTGQPQISIPLFTAKGKTLELPIALSYNASGIRVEEVGSWVGMGWTLEAGGVITRTVRGIADEQDEGYFNTGATFYDPANWNDPVPAAIATNIHDAQTLDGEPDQFFFNFAGFSGEMVGGDTSTLHGSNSNIFVTAPYRKWRIIPTFGSDGSGARIVSSWEITTENGTKYTFGAPEIHQDRSTVWAGSGGKDSKGYVSAWYLTKIRAVSGDSIMLGYTDYTAEHLTGMYREEAIMMYQSGTGCQLGGYQQGPSKIYDVHTQSYARAKRLTTITSAAHTITFSTSLRDDAQSPQYGWFISLRQQQEPKLDAITVQTPSGVVLRRFSFEYTYGGSLGGRLTLLNVYEEDASGHRLPPYTFSYSGPTLPARVTDKGDYHDGTASFALDHWGYYNGADSNSTPIPPGTSTWNLNTYPGGDRNPNIAYDTAGVLTKITYPTGGFNEFVYEANDYSNGGSLISDPIRHNASASIMGTGPDHSTTFTVGGVDATVIGTLDITMTPACGPSPCPYGQLKDGNTVIGTWTTTQSGPYTFIRGHTYTLTASVQGRTVTVAAITAHWDERIALTKKTGGGLRIKEVHADDGLGNVMVRTFRYELPDGKSSGWLTVEPRYDANYNLAVPGGSQCIYYSRSSQPQTILGAGPLIGYSAVAESLGVNGVFGSISRTFAAGCDCAEAAQAHGYDTQWPMLRYTTAGWTRGQQLSEEYRNASGQRQRATTWLFGIPPWPHPIIEFRGMAIDLWSMWQGTSGWWMNRFYVRTGLKVQTDQATTAYDTTGANGVTSNQHSEYGNVSHAQLTEITETNSDGTQRITRLKYPGDYLIIGNPSGSEAAALAAMQNVTPAGAHMPGVAIERSVSVKTGASDRVVQAEITTFKEFLTGQFLPFKHYVLNSPSPLP